MNIKADCYRTVLALIFLVAITLRVAVPNIERPLVVGDETTYNYSALNLLKYHTLTREVTGEVFRGEWPATPTSALSPGYPIYIAAVYKLFGASERNALVSNITLSIIAFWLMQKILLLLRASRVGTLCALSIAAVYPGFLYNLDRMLTEHLYLTLFLGFIYLFILGAERRNLWALAGAGLILGMATHVRAQALPFAIIAITYLIIYGTDGRQRAKSTAVFASLFLLCMLPWWLRNYAVFHKFILLTEASDGARIWGAVPYFLDMADTANKSLKQIAHENYIAAPFAYVRWKLFGYMNFMWADAWDEYVTHPGRFLQRASFITQMLFIVPAIAAIPLVARKRIPSWTLVACIPLIVTVSNVPFHGLPRYALPAVPFAILVVAMLLTQAERPDLSGLNRVQSTVHAVGHRLFFWMSVVFSGWAIYSVYIFPHRIPQEMASYRLGKYAHTSIDAAKRGEIIFDRKYDLEHVTVDNSIRRANTTRFKNPPDAPGIFKFEAQDTQADVTRVSLRMRGGAPYDYVTLYWATKAQPTFSESRAYRVPRFWIEHKRSFYIDGDAEKFLLVPSVLRGNRFDVDSIHVVKYGTSNPDDVAPLPH